MIAEVVTYDPVRRKGFMKRLDQPSRRGIHFALGMLPRDFKQPVIETSRRLNRIKKMPRVPAESVFRELMDHIKGMVVGQQFSFEAVPREDGRLVIKRKTVQHLGDSAH